MDVEEETLKNAGLATLGVLVFVAFLVAGSMMGAGSGNDLGAYVIVAGIVAFVVVMGAIGLLFLGD